MDETGTSFGAGRRQRDLSVVRPEDLPITPERIREIWREDLVAVLLSSTVIMGLFLDGWNHLILQKGRLGSFFTPWHGLLYAGFAANAAWVVSRNKHLWTKGVPTNPAFFAVGRFRLRYPYAVAGIGLVFFGMVGDLVWHTVLGEETDVARVIAPFHIVLFTGAALLIAAPLRSAWHAPAVYPHRGTFKELLPPILSVALLTAAGSFLFQWLSPFMDWTATSLGSLTGIAPQGPGLQTAMAARVVMADILLLAPVLLALRRWSLPWGTATATFTVVALAMTALTSFTYVGTALAALLGGAAADLVIERTRNCATSTTMFAVAVVVPLVCWPSYFVLLALVYDAHWPVDFYLGLSCLCAMAGLTLAFFASLPSFSELSTSPAQGDRVG
jgi:hypothetical protein